MTRDRYQLPCCGSAMNQSIVVGGLIIFTSCAKVSRSNKCIVIWYHAGGVVVAINCAKLSALL